MLEIGSFLSDRYEILSKVGAGGMSDVYIIDIYDIRMLKSCC